MSDDRELLELAAKADGITIRWSPIKLDWEGSHPIYWNPLVENDHAFRLAVKLGIDVRQNRFDAAAVSYYFGTVFIEDYGTDPCAATRRAIVRAAADIAQRKG